MLVDVGRIEDRYFLNVTGFGFDIAVLDDLENIPLLTGDLLYLGAALRQLFKFDGMHDRHHDGGAWRAARARTSCSSSRTGATSAGCSRSRRTRASTTGSSTRSRFSTRPPLTRISMLAAAPSGKHVRNPLVLSEQAASFTLKFGAPPAYETDGEYNTAQVVDARDLVHSAARCAWRPPDLSVTVVKAIRFAAPIPTYLATLAAGKLSRRFYTGALACTRYARRRAARAAERAMGAHPHAARRHLRQRSQRHLARREPVDVAVLVASRSCSATRTWAR